MGKTSLCIQMLELLNTGRVYKVSELAEILETNSRNIIEYKKELEEAGYYITSVSGKYGGYKLDETSIFPAVKLSSNEKNALLEAYNYLLSCNNFMLASDFQTAFSKIISSINHDGIIKNLININSYPLDIDKNELVSRYNLVYEAIKERKSIVFNFNSIINFHPYDLFIYNSDWYVIGWNVELCDIAYYKLNQMNELEKTKNRFNIWKYYNVNDYIDSSGFKNAKYIACEIVFNTNPQIDRIYGKNQMFSQENNKYILSLNIENIKDIITLILDNYKHILSIHPNSIKDEIVNVLEKLNKL